MTALRIGIGGINGRMGQAIREAASELEEVTVNAGVVRAGSGGTDDTVMITTDPAGLLDHIDAFIDVSTRQAMLSNLAAMREAGVPYAVGVTGLETEQFDALGIAAMSIPVLIAPNFSFGVAAVSRLIELAARTMPDSDVEIVETHHRRKRDAPSGTALAFVDAVGRGRSVPVNLAIGRSGDSLRVPDEIGVHSLRGGSNPGEHRIHFLLDGEEVVIEHRALSRAAYARGALLAARWLVQQPPGRYSMHDVVAMGR